MGAKTMQVPCREQKTYNHSVFNYCDIYPFAAIKTDLNKKQATAVCEYLYL